MTLSLEMFNFLSREMERKKFILSMCAEFEDPVMINAKTQLKEQIEAIGKMLVRESSA